MCYKLLNGLTETDYKFAVSVTHAQAYVKREETVETLTKNTWQVRVMLPYITIEHQPTVTL